MKLLKFRFTILKYIYNSECLRIILLTNKMMKRFIINPHKLIVEHQSV